MKPIFWSMYLLVGLGVYADQVNFCNDFPEPDPVGCAVSGAIAGILWPAGIGDMINEAGR